MRLRKIAEVGPASPVNSTQHPTPTLLGDQFYMIALPWLVLQLTGNALVLGTIMALAAVPREPPQHAAPVRHHAPPLEQKAAPLRPPQFVVVSFDGAGGESMWTYWRAVARRAQAHFTFFVSGAYLVDWAHRDRYRPPRHARGSSAIGFALPTGELPRACRGGR